MKISFSALDIAHSVISEHVKSGDLCIDATAGRGRDTAFLCRLVGDFGKVIAFDIQSDAVQSTKALLAEQKLDHIAEVFLDSHANMEQYAQENTVSCVVFNFGWLPGGDHNIFTRPDSSIAAIEAAMKLLKPGGLISMCIYYGRETGFDERDTLLEYFNSIDSAHYSVVVSQFVNRTNCPPIMAYILKDM